MTAVNGDDVASLAAMEEWWSVIEGASADGLARPQRTELLPVTGAWQPGDPAAGRRFVRSSREFALEGGGSLPEITIAYETWGELNADGSNAILVCHALTGDAHAAGPSGPGQPTEGWWDPLIGPGRVLDTDRYFIVCPNVLGGCQGSTGPASVDPRTGRPYGSTFPTVSVRDCVRSQCLVAEDLGVSAWHSVIGGSMGGMQALEWAIIYPDRLQSLVVIASTAAASAQQIAWSATGRRAIAADAKWRNGDYYDAEPGDGPSEGFSVARQVAQIHYRSEVVFADRFGRDTAEPLDRFSAWQNFEVESYLDYHGAKLVKRFDANSYLVLNKLMDLHDIGRNRGGVAAALARVRVPVCTMSIDSDTLYPPYQQEELRDLLVAAGRKVDHVVVESPHGHDGFLLEFDQVGAGLEKFLQTITG